MIQGIRERIEHPSILLLIVLGLVTIVVGTAIDLLGYSMMAGYMGMLGSILLLFAIISYGSFYLLKKTSPLFMNYDTGSKKRA